MTFVERIKKSLGIKTIFLLVLFTDLFFIIDLYFDYIKQTSILHLAVDQTLVLISTIILGMLFPRLLKQMELMGYELKNTQKKLLTSHQENLLLQQGVTDYIVGKLSSWQLTAGEKDIFFLLIKGLSFSEIANIRKTKEQTVRQQALSIYKKTGLKGRKELAAYFLEDFFQMQC